MLVYPDQTTKVLFLFVDIFVRPSPLDSYNQSMLEAARTLYPLNCACDSLCPREVTWILSDCTLYFIPLVVPPDTVFLRSHTINVSICRYTSVSDMTNLYACLTHFDYAECRSSRLHR